MSVVQLGCALHDAGDGGGVDIEELEECEGLDALGGRRERVHVRGGQQRATHQGAGPTSCSRGGSATDRLRLGGCSRPPTQRIGWPAAVPAYFALITRALMYLINFAIGHYINYKFRCQKLGGKATLNLRTQMINQILQLTPAAQAASAHHQRHGSGSHLASRTAARPRR